MENNTLGNGFTLVEFYDADKYPNKRAASVDGAVYTTSVPSDTPIQTALQLVRTVCTCITGDSDRVAFVINGIEYNAN